MANEPLYYTYQDAVDHVLDLFQMTRDARNHRQARRAVQQAYRDVWNQHDWQYSHQRFSIVTTAAYSTGTVVYDHTGGASERLLTFTGATLPSDAAYGSIIIGDRHYEIDARLSDTTATLTESNNPGADVSSTTYTWYRDCYPLPVGTRAITRLVDVAGVAREVCFVPADEWLALTRGYDTTGWPYFFTFTRDMNYTGRVCIRFGPPPSDSRTYDMFGIFGDGKMLKTEIASAGTVTTSSTTVTGTGTAFASKHIGSVIRFGTTAAPPTNMVGGLDFNDDNPFAAQRIVTAVASTTSLTINEALTTELTGVRYTISDLIDIDEPAMHTAFLRGLETEMSILLNQTQNSINQRQQRYNMALREARAADNRKRYAGNQVVMTPVSLGDIGTIDLEA